MEQRLLCKEMYQCPICYEPKWNGNPGKCRKCQQIAKKEYWKEYRKTEKYKKYRKEYNKKNNYSV